MHIKWLKVSAVIEDLAELPDACKEFMYFSLARGGSLLLRYSEESTSTLTKLGEVRR